MLKEQSKTKKACAGLRKSLYNPEVKGCGRELVISARNFFPHNQSKDGFTNICRRCKDEAREAIAEFKLNRKPSKAQKAKLKAKARKIFGSIPSAPAPAPVPEPEPELDLEVPVPVPEPESVIPPEPEPEPVPEPKVLDYPEVNLGQKKKVDEFDIHLYRPRLTSLNQLFKEDANMVTFLHSIMVNEQHDNWSHVDLVKADMCKRFRAVKGSTLKGFTLRGNRDELILRQTVVSGWDKKTNREIKSTVAYQVSQFGIEWYSSWVKGDGELPDLVVPAQLKDPVKAPPANSSTSLAFADADNLVAAAATYIQYIKDYRNNNGDQRTWAEVSAYMGVPQHTLVRASGEGFLAKKWYERIREHMKLNPNGIPETRFSEPDDEKKPHLPMPEPEVIQFPDKPASGGSSSDNDAYLIDAIAKANVKLKLASVEIYKAGIKRDLIQQKIDFLTSKLMTI